MNDLVALHARAADAFDACVASITADQWGDLTPCTGWDVRALVNHLVYEALWAPELFAGKTVEEVGNRYDSDQLGDDPLGSWRSANAGARVAIAEPGALERTVHLSWTDAPGSEYVNQLLLDLAVHGWDLAHAIGADETIEPEVLEAVAAYVDANEGLIRGSGVFGDDLVVGPGVDPQTKLLAALGRRA